MKYTRENFVLLIIVFTYIILLIDTKVLESPIITGQGTIGDPYRIIDTVPKQDTVAFDSSIVSSGGGIVWFIEDNDIDYGADGTVKVHYDDTTYIFKRSKKRLLRREDFDNGLLSQ
jgi:hypothetical protein